MLCPMIYTLYNKEFLKVAIVKTTNKSKEVSPRRKADARWLDKNDIASSSYNSLEVVAPSRARNIEVMDDKFESSEMVEFTTQIVSAYVANNAVVAGELPGLIGEVHAALSRASSNMAPPPKEELKPAVAVKKSLTPDYIICLEDGKKFKSLKRHLRTHYNMSPEEYREKWNLEPNYPMVAPKYAEARSNLAKKMGLGQRKGR